MVGWERVKVSIHFLHKLVRQRSKKTGEPRGTVTGETENQSQSFLQITKSFDSRRKDLHPPIDPRYLLPKSTVRPRVGSLASPSTCCELFQKKKKKEKKLDQAQLSNIFLPSSQIPSSSHTYQQRWPIAFQRTRPSSPRIMQRVAH